MKFLLFLADFLIPFVIFYILLYGMLQGIDVYGSFLSGVKEGLKIVVGIAPTLIALMVSVGVFRTSGALDFLCSLLKPVCDPLSVPVDLLPVFVVRLFSSSAATGFLLDLFKEYGPDSEIGMMASIMMCCTETVLYTITVYYMSVDIKKTRWTLPGALFASLAGAAASIVITRMMS